MRRSVYIFLAMIFAFALLAAGCGSNQEGASQTEGEGEASSEGGVSGTIPFYTPGSGGTNYIIAAGISQMFNSSKIMPEVNLVTEATKGTEEGIQLIMERHAQGKAAFGALGADIIDRMYEGSDEKLGHHPELRAVSWIGSIGLHLVVPADSPIQSLADLKGKRVGLLPPGAAANNLLTALLEEGYGLAPEEYNGIPLPQAEVSEAIQNGSIDAGIITGVIPAPLVNELGNIQEIRVIPVDEDILEQFLANHPYYSSVRVEAGTYPGQDEDLLIATFESNIVTHEGTDEELVYNLIKMIMENVDELANVHPAAANLTEENVLKGFRIPLHPGAERYYKEIGLLDE